MADERDAQQDQQQQQNQQNEADGQPRQIRVRVLSQFKTLYDDQALSVSAENATGPFDILYDHANFLTLLSPGTIVIRRNDDTEREIDVKKGSPSGRR